MQTEACCWQYLEVLFCSCPDGGESGDMQIASNGLYICIVHCSCNLRSKNWVCVVYHPKTDSVYAATLYFSVVFEELSCVLLNWLCFLLRWQLRRGKLDVCLTECCSSSRGYCILSQYNFRSNRTPTYALVHSCFSAVCFLNRCACTGWLI